ncbi:hypothetical protein [Zavarzinella formosa]|uniref:hypothetical protein n=1 Tax=Zavarzinella formosa TaxID=360055 RepID=UPI0002E3A847|nr:hypothetical protein [Zavarzinella formosa]
MSVEVSLTPEAAAALEALPDEVRLLAAEHLLVFQQDWQSVTRMAYAPVAPGYRTGYRVRRADQSVYLLEFRFRWLADATIAVIRRVDWQLEEHAPWLLDPTEWYDEQQPYPRITVDW